VQRPCNVPASMLAFLPRQPPDSADPGKMWARVRGEGPSVESVRRSALAVLAALALLLATAAASTATPPRVLIAAASDDSADAPATELRVLLSRLLGEHTFLLMESVRANTLDTPEAEALAGALAGNTDDLVNAIGSVYGDDAATGFRGLWDQHIDLLVDHAAAIRDGRTGDAEASLAGLSTFRHAFAAFLAAANPDLDGHGEADTVQLHLDQVVAFSDGDYAKAYEAEREAFRHMFEFGDHLAKAIGDQFPETFTGARVAWSPASQLRLTLDRILAEHLVLAAQAMRTGLADAADAGAARAALDANSAELAEAVGTVYGDAAGERFLELWDRHVDAYLAFIDAYAAGDDAGREAALMTLHAYHEEIATFLATANPHLPRAAVSDLIRRHVQALITQVEATEAGDHVRAVATIRSAYGFMFDVGDALAAGIAAQFPDRFRGLAELPPTDAAATLARPLDRGLGAAVLAGSGLLALLLITAAAQDRAARHGGASRKSR
jgi:hypothetical protein